MTVTVNAGYTQPVSDLQKVAVGLPSPPVLVMRANGANKLDGTYHPADGNVAWWGTQLAGADGKFATVHSLWNRDNRDVWGVDFCFDEQTGQYAKTMTIAVMNADNSYPYVVSVNNTLVKGIFNFPTVYKNAAAVYINVTEWSVPGDFAKISLFKAQDTRRIVVSWADNSYNTEAGEVTVDTVYYTDTTLDIETYGDGSITAVGVYPEATWDMQTYGETQVYNVYTAFNDVTALGRSVHAKVEITYTDPFNDNTIQIEAPTGKNSSTAYLIDGISDTTYPGFFLSRNNLSGFYHAIPDPVAKVNPPAWWGNTISDMSGMFLPAQKITIKFSPRSLNSLRLDGDTALDEYPSDFYYVVYSGITQLYRIDVTDNTQVHWFHELPETLLAVDRIELYVTKTNKPNVVLKISEMFTNIVETYYTDDISSIHLLDEIGYASGSIPIGNISANEVDISIDNSTRQFDLNNKASNLYGFVKRNRKVKVFFGIDLPSGLEWLQMGTFYTTSWDVASDSLVATLVARDRLEILRQSIFYRSLLYVNKTVYELFEIVLQDAGLIADADYVLDNDLKTITVPYAWFMKQSHREALQHLASCAIIQVFCMRDGRIRVNLDLDATKYAVTTYTDDDMIFNAKYPLAVEEQVNSVDVSYSSYTISAEEELYAHQVPITLKPKEVLETDFVFSNVPVQSITSVTKEGHYSIVVTYEAYAWGVKVRIENLNVSETGTLTKMTFKGYRGIASDSQSVTAEDTQSILEDGILATSVSHTFIQTKAAAETLANVILTSYKEARYDITMDDRGNAAVELADKLRVLNAQRNAEYMVTRMNFSWDGALSATTEGKILKVLD